MNKYHRMSKIEKLFLAKGCIFKEREYEFLREGGRR